MSRSSESGSYSTIAGLAVHGRLEQAAQRIGLGLAGLVHLGDDRRRGLDAPAHGPEDLLQFGGGELDVELLERGVHAVAEDVVVLEELVAECLRAASWRLRRAGRRAPRSWRRAASSSSSREALLRAAALFLVVLVLVAAPFGQALLQRGGDLGEVGEELVAELFVERGADVLVAGGEAQRLDGLERELAVQAQRALDRDLPVAEGGVGEDLRLLASP